MPQHFSKEWSDYTVDFCYLAVTATISQPSIEYLSESHVDSFILKISDVLNRHYLHMVYFIVGLSVVPILPALFAFIESIEIVRIVLALIIPYIVMFIMYMISTSDSFFLAGNDFKPDNFTCELPLRMMDNTHIYSIDCVLHIFKSYQDAYCLIYYYALFVCFFNLSVILSRFTKLRLQKYSIYDSFRYGIGF